MQRFQGLTPDAADHAAAFAAQDKGIPCIVADFLAGQDHGRTGDADIPLHRAIHLAVAGQNGSPHRMGIVNDLRVSGSNGVRENIAIFVIPLCATIHLAGSTMKITACAMAIMYMSGEPVTFTSLAGFIMMLGITMIAAPGVPGGAIMAALGLLQSMLGFNETLQALMIALYIAMDSFGTACNVTGDGAIAVVVDKIAGKQKTGTSQP